ncbi:Ribonuclease P protein subunit p20 [Trichoplax sp. H2]|uniref:Ribonuclease P protein subunit p20 n=1 Tax=Trichoplax adhaerens TaxID=10228 RepID=B3RMM4_TRIAD|nr:hypothetical protein TRIADDRAFT_52855 [Trichoplax adhaerens]EDV27299.1 hypothetical protein TRIADDRAFT_52855 [Trichoplax adhaerens]RDD36968.1 Ribonuclease P protein subunit p20 [Trichoplax sp. H2]|eukprot:XP_002109133.1 hypothetical protein TRIADDRAFT_52855 [Trichoplax adhaerens]
MEEGGGAEAENQEYLIRKRLPRSLPKRKNDVYVTRKTNFAAQIKKCSKLLESEFTEIHIHGLGAAVNRAINLALQLKLTSSGGLEVSTTTSTVELFDDFESLDETLPSKKSQLRQNSAIHIKVYKIIKVAS